MDELIVFLQNKGHECMQIHGMANHTFKWCQKDICPETVSNTGMARRQLEFEDDLAMLKRQGHVCVIVYDTYPGRMDWCKHVVCKGKRK